MRYLLLMTIGWAVPGAGHLLGGRRGRGLFYLIAIGGTFLAGLWLTNWRSVRFEDNPFYYAGQWGCGAIAFVCHSMLPPHNPLLFRNRLSASNSRTKASTPRSWRTCFPIWGSGGFLKTSARLPQAGAGKPAKRQARKRAR